MHHANFEFLIESGEKFIVSDKFIDDERKITKGRGMFKKKKSQNVRIKKRNIWQTRGCELKSNFFYSTS